MKLNKLKHKGFYTTDLENRETIYEVIVNTDKEWLKAEPDAKLLVDIWDYKYTDDNDRKCYTSEGTLNVVQHCQSETVYKVDDIGYKLYGNNGACLMEDKSTYKDRFGMLLKGDKITLNELKALLETVKDTDTYTKLEKIIKSMEEDVINA